MYLMYTLDEQGKRVYTLKVRGRGERQKGFVAETIAVGH